MGSLIVFEGLDGTGKSTQAIMLSNWLRDQSFYPKDTKEPTNVTDHGKKLRQAEFTARLSLEDELDLFYRDRVEHTEMIRDWLKWHDFVIQDRSYWSTLAYQSVRGADLNELREKHSKIALVPDVLFIFDLPLEASLKRIGARGDKSVFEGSLLEKSKQIYDGFRHPNLVRIDGTQDCNKIHRIVRAHALASYNKLIKKGKLERWKNHCKKGKP